MNDRSKSHIVDAKYYTNHPIIYRGNPFCESLVYLSNYAEIRNALRGHQPFDPALRQESAHHRISMLLQLKKFYEPVSRDIGLYISVRDQMFAIYASLQISDSQYFEKITRAREPELPEILIDAANSYEPSPVAIIGPSGSGKSSAIRRVCATIPRVILHTKYNGELFFVTQIPWIKINVPANASLVTFFKQAFQKYDALLGTRYQYTYGSGSITNQLVAFNRVVTIHGTVLIIVDNVDQLATKKSGGRESLVNHLYNLVEGTNAMIVFVGTEAAEQVIAEKVPQARRIEENESPAWGPLSYLEWKKNFEVLWSYQLTQDFTPLTDAIRGEFFKWTLGSLSVTITLFRHVQNFAITSRQQRGNEIIDVNCIAQIAQLKLPRTTRLLIHPLANRLNAKTQNKNKITLKTSNDCATTPASDSDSDNEMLADATSKPRKKRNSIKNHPVNESPNENAEKNYQQLLTEGIIQDCAPEQPYET